MSFKEHVPNASGPSSTGTRKSEWVTVSAVVQAIVGALLPKKAIVLYAQNVFKLGEGFDGSRSLIFPLWWRICVVVEFQRTKLNHLGFEDAGYILMEPRLAFLGRVEKRTHSFMKEESKVREKGDLIGTHQEGSGSGSVVPLCECKDHRAHMAWENARRIWEADGTMEVGPYPDPSLSSSSQKAGSTASVSGKRDSLRQHVTARRFLGRIWKHFQKKHGP